jgi:hypothetical protein
MGRFYATVFAIDSIGSAIAISNLAVALHLLCAKRATRHSFTWEQAHLNESGQAEMQSMPMSSLLRRVCPHFSTSGTRGGRVLVSEETVQLIRVTKMLRGVEKIHRRGQKFDTGHAVRKCWSPLKSARW